MTPKGFLRCLPAVLVSVGLITLSFAPSQLRPLAWVALAPLLVSLRSTTLRTAMALGALWGMAGAYCVTDWLPRAVALYYGQPLWLGLALFASAAFTMGAIYYMIFAAFYWWLGSIAARLVPILAGAAWVAAEFGRCRMLGGNPWGLLGYTQTGYIASESAGAASLLRYAPLQVLQAADLGGVYAVSFVVAITNAALAELWLAYRRGGSRRRIATELTCVAVVLLAVATYGQVRLSRGLVDAGPEIEVAVVQGNVDMGSQWHEAHYGENLIAYLRLTHAALKSGEPRVIFWPENSMTFFVDTEPAYRSQIARVTRPADVELVAGAPRREGDLEEKYFNSAFVIRPDGDVTARYDKEHLLPFAEYFPFGSIDYLRRSFGRVGEFTAGRDPGPLPTRAGVAGVAICNEAMFASVVGERIRAGATYLVNLSNDTWIQDTEFAEQQFNLVSMRAVEQRRYLVRASTSGPSGIVDPFGRITARTRPFSADFVAGRVRAIEAKSFYGRHGDLFAGACLVAVLGFWLIRRDHRKLAS